MPKEMEFSEKDDKQFRLDVEDMAMRFSECEDDLAECNKKLAEKKEALFVSIKQYNRLMEKHVTILARMAEAECKLEECEAMLATKEEKLVECLAREALLKKSESSSFHVKKPMEMKLEGGPTGIKMQVLYDITDCRNCPFANKHIGQGECWTECTNRSTGRGAYDNILWGCHEDFKAVPPWCPLGLFKDKQP